MTLSPALSGLTSFLTAQSALPSFVWLWMSSSSPFQKTTIAKKPQLFVAGQNLYALYV